MTARAAYFAKQDARFASYLSEGRSFGPHGKGLVIANSIRDYDDGLSQELTRLTLEANLRIRDLGFKPYVAPAVASGAMQLLLTLRGAWHCYENFAAAAPLCVFGACLSAWGCLLASGKRRRDFF